MNKKEIVVKWLSIVAGIGVIIAAAVGIYSSNGGESFTVLNMYGDKVELYGTGLYAYNSVETVANQLGADLVGILAAVIFLVFSLWKKRTLLVEIIQTSVAVYLAYYTFSFVFGLSMNRLYLFYVICFGLSLYVSFIKVRNLVKSFEIPESIKKKRLTGTGIFLIISGVLTAVLWVLQIIPATMSNSYSTLLGVKTTEVTFGLDLSVTCPISIICGVWILEKKKIGYIIAPILLNMLVGIAILVICQKVFWAKLGLYMPIQILIGFIISFVILGTISLYLVIKLLVKLKKEIKINPNV